MAEEDEKALVKAAVALLSQRIDYKSTTYLEGYVRDELLGIVRKIALEVVEADPSIHEEIRRRVTAVVSEAIAGDEQGWLQKAVITAVSEALAVRRTDLGWD